MIGNAHFFAEVVLCGSEQEYADYLTSCGIRDELLAKNIDHLKRTGGGAAMIIDHDTLDTIRRFGDGIEHQEKNGIALGGHVVVVNFFGLTPEEMFAVVAHESGHVACGHRSDDGEDELRRELEADRMAAYEVGADLMKSALIKLRNRLIVSYPSEMSFQHFENLNARIEALTF